MKPSPRTVEIIRIKEDSILTFTIEVFKISKGYQCFARNNFAHQQELVGSGFHEDKQISIDQALNELRSLMI